jgi:hypothetical protein
MTTLFDGVNENGVIVSHGRGSQYDTYIDAFDSTPVNLLIEHDIPVVFYDSTRNEYHDFLVF